MASVTYKIGGKYDNSAMKQAQKGLQDFQKAVNAFKGAVVVTALTSVAKKALECESAFLEANKAVQKIDFAASINPNLQKTSKQLQDFANTVSARLRGAVSVDELNEQIAKLSFDKTGEQIEKLIPAAIDLSAAMGTSLSDAVTQLNQTFAGTTGQLGKMFPELKNLSKEALASGEAIDIIASKTRGMGEEISKSGVGSVQAYKNELDNMKEAIGRATTTFFTPLRDYITEQIKLWTDAKNAALDYKDALKANKQGNATLDQLKLLSDKATQEVTDYQNSYYKNESGKYQNRFNPDDILSVKGYVQGLSDLIEKQKEAANAYLTAQTIAQNAQNAQNNKNANGTKTAVSTTITPAVEVVKESAQTIADRMRQAGEAALAYAEHQKSANDEVIELQIAYRKAREEELKKTTNMIASTLMGGTGEIGSLIGAGIAGGPIGVLNELIGKILSVVTNMNNEVAYFQNIITEFIKATIEPLSNAISQLLSPILEFIWSLIPSVQGIFNAIGSIIKVIADLINIFSPVLEGISAAVKVISTVVVIVADLISNLLTAIYNAIISVYNFFAKHDKEKKAYKNIEADVNAIWSPSNTYSPDLSGYATLAAARTSGSATYTAQRDIYVNIYYNNSFVNGDARAIAIGIRDEIRAAERMGY